jgi:hypothetical protein
MVISTSLALGIIVGFTVTAIWGRVWSRFLGLFERPNHTRTETERKSEDCDKQKKRDRDIGAFTAQNHDPEMDASVGPTARPAKSTLPVQPNIHFLSSQTSTSCPANHPLPVQPNLHFLSKPPLPVQPNPQLRAGGFSVRWNGGCERGAVWSRCVGPVC